MYKGIPDNPKLYENMVSQAKAKYPKRRGKGTSPQANKMIDALYTQAGGGWTNDRNSIDPKKRDFKKEAEDKEKAKAARKKREMKKRNLVV